MYELPFISIVIASFNRKDIIEESIKSAINQNYPSNKVEVLLVDNNSSDGTIEEVKLIFNKDIKSEKLKLIPLNYNSGSSGSCIEAINFINPRWDYILKMDEDIVLDKSCLTEMIKTANKNVYEGMIGGKVLFYQKRNIIHAIGSHLNPFFAIAKGIGVNKKNDYKYDKSKSFDGVSGCMVLIPKSIYEKVGWFDKDYFLYYDDHDLMYKSTKAGFKHVYSPKAVGYHDTATGNKKKYANQQWLYYSTRGSLLFLKKNFKKFSIKYLIYLISHNLKFLIGLFFILIYSKNNKIIRNLHLYSLGFLHGIKNKGGYFDINNQKLKILILCGGRGGQQLGNGIDQYLKKINKKLEISYLVNCYDDGKSTGKIREFFNNDILGPSDIRKIHQNIYTENNKNINKNILNFFNLRFNLNEKTKKELREITDSKFLKKENLFNIDFSTFPEDLKELCGIAIKHFLQRDINNFICNDFSITNLIYAALADYYKSMQKAEEKIRIALNLESKVILNSDDNKFIFALTENGNLLANEEEIVNYQKISPIYQIYVKNKKLKYEDIKKFNTLNNFEEKKYFINNISDELPTLSNEAKKLIKNSNIIIFSPGTQHSSLYPTYFTKDLGESIKSTKAVKYFITNILIDNEMPGFNSSDQVRQAIFYLNQKNLYKYNINQFIDVLIVNKPDNNDIRYLRINLNSLEQLNLKKYIFEKVEDVSSDNGIHDSYKLASLIFNFFYKKWK